MFIQINKVDIPEIRLPCNVQCQYPSVHSQTKEQLLYFSCLN